MMMDWMATRGKAGQDEGAEKEDLKVRHGELAYYGDRLERTHVESRTRRRNGFVTVEETMV